MSFVEANGLRFHVQELGAGGGRSVVMLHGLLIGSLASWYFTAAPALAAERRVRMFDLRGHGKSERAPRGYDVRTLAGDLLALCADLTAPFDLVGHSWGALVALELARAHPQRVRRLALVEAPLPPADALAMTTFLAPDGALPGRLLDALPEALRAQVTGGGRQAQRFLASLGALVNETTLLADVRAEPDPSDDALARVACPTLLVYGESSACRPAGLRLARVIPGARLLLLPGGHFLHLDAKAALTAALAEHLRG